MNIKKFMVLLLLPSISIFCETGLSVDNHYSIIESKKGFLNYSVVKDNKEILPVLESGSFVNSRIYISDSDKRFYLRDKSKYIIKNETGKLIIKWRTLTLDVIETYTALSDRSGVNYNIVVDNRTGYSRNVGLYLMYDTYLGEKANRHFIVDDYQEINREKSYSGIEIPRSIKSLNKDNIGVEFRFRDDEITSPDILILGNWDQLAKSKKWPYIPKNGGLFSNGYYSINDSGLGVVFSKKGISEGGSISYNFNILFQNKTLRSVVKKESKTDTSKWGEESNVVSTESITEPLSVEEEPVVDELITETLPVKEKDLVVVENESIVESPSVEEEPVVAENKSIIESPSVEEESVVVEEIKPLIDESLSIVDPEKEELRRMLEYIQKKKRGEDVSEYDFDEAYILKKLKERHEQ